MGSGSEDAQSVDIDWNDYSVDTDQWGDRVVIHEARGCMEKSDENYWIWSVQDAIDWAKEHHEKCRI